MNLKCLLLFTVWFTDCSAGRINSGLIDDDFKIAAKISKHHHKRITRQLIDKKYDKLYEQPDSNFRSNNISTVDTVDIFRNKRMTNEEQQAIFDEVFGANSIDNSKQNSDVTVDETWIDDPGLNENIKRVFGASSDRLLARNNMNEYSRRDDSDNAIEDEDRPIKRTNLNEMIVKNFGPELIDDATETTVAEEDRPTPDSSNTLSSNLSLLYLLLALILI